MLLSRKKIPRADFDENGFTVLKGVVPEGWDDELIRAIENLTFCEGDDWHPSYRYKCVFNRDPFWLRYLDLPGLVDFAEDVLGGDCHVVGETAWKSVPGHAGSPPHLDYNPFPLPDAIAEQFTPPVMILTAHIFPHPLTGELGPTRVIAGSHRWGGRFRGDKDYSPVFPGRDVLVFRSDLWHGGDPNRTADQNRYLLQVHYGRRQVAQHFHPYLTWSWNPAVLKACNPRQRRLLGGHPLSNYD